MLKKCSPKKHLKKHCHDAEPLTDKKIKELIMATKQNVLDEIKKVKDSVAANVAALQKQIDDLKASGTSAADLDEIKTAVDNITVPATV